MSNKSEENKKIEPSDKSHEESNLSDDPSKKREPEPCTGYRALEPPGGKEIKVYAPGEEPKIRSPSSAPWVYKPKRSKS